MFVSGKRTATLGTSGSAKSASEGMRAGEFKVVVAVDAG